jgi:Zn-dependent metalloprotease
MHGRSSIYCIIPPYMLREIVENGTQEQRQQALRNIVSAEAVRMQREVISKEGPEELVMEAAATARLSRLVYTAENSGNLPGRVVRREGDPPTGDPAADEAYDGAGVTYALFDEVYNRVSIDGNGMQIDSTVHFRTGYDNAFWNGRQMVYGDGDEDLPVAQRLFNRFTIALDIIGHELAHGVTQFTANLVYQGQSGAVNESMSDVFGSLVKQRTRGQTAAEADWIVGEGLFTPNVNGVGIRSMKEPGTAYNDPVLGRDPQPAHMRDYVQTQSDNGGVHINSGIPNRAFYVTAFNIGGFAWEKAGQIWYVTLRSKLTDRSDFATTAVKTYEAARDLFGQGSLEQQAVRAGWAEVGIDVETGPVPPPGGGDQRPGCVPTLAGLIRSLAGPRH